MKMADYYREHYGNETNALFAAMKNPAMKIALINPFLSTSAQDQLRALGSREDALPENFSWLPTDLTPHVIDGIMSHYFLDLSSAYAQNFLPIASDARVLDMCSAPGGKLLALMSRRGSHTKFLANDVSSARYARLHRVVSNYVPANLTTQIVQLAMKDANMFGLRYAQQFDAILLDTPCSSEAHVLADKKLLTNFVGPQKGLPHRQYSLLCSALLALKPGGFVLYATCSINPRENQDVIAKALRKKNELCKLVDLQPILGRKTEYGVEILPHLHGAGPAFFCLLRRVSDA